MSIMSVVETTQSAKRERPKDSVTKLKTYFSTPDNPVGAREFMEFWKSLTDGEKDYFAFFDLSTLV